MFYSGGVFSSEKTKWLNLYANSSFGNQVLLDLDPSTKKIRFTFDKPKINNKKEVFVLDADTPENVSKSIVKLSDKMKNSWGLRSGVQESIVKKLSELIYLNTKTGKVLHFGVSGRSPASRAPAYSRSVGLFNIRLSSSNHLFQMRAVLDESSNIERFSLVSEEQDMSKFEVTRKGESIALVSKKDQKVLFFFRINEHGDDLNEVVFYNKLQGFELEQFTRNRYSLKRNDSEWLVQRYSESDHEFIDFTEEVVLTNKSVGHEPVVRVQGSDKYFPSFSEEEISNLISKVLLISSSETLESEFQSTYHNCMIEKYQVALSSKKSPDESELLEGCKKVALLHVEYKDLLEKSKLQLSESEISTEDLEKAMLATHLEFKSCLVEKDIMIKDDFHSEINFIEISSREGGLTFLENLVDCKQTAKGRSYVEEMQRSVEGEANLTAVGTTSQTDYIMGAKQLSEASYKKCTDKIGARYADFCKDYSELVSSSSLFEKSHLSLLKGSRKKTFRDCIALVQKSALTNFKSGQSHEKVLSESHKSQVACAAIALQQQVEDEGISGIETFLSRIDFIKGLGIRVSSSVLSEVKQSVRTCLIQKSNESITLSDLLSRHDQNLEACRISSVKDKLPLFYKFVTNIRINKFTNDKEITEYLEGRITRNLKRQIRDLVTVADINSTIAKDSIFSFSMIISKIITENLKSTFSLDVEDNQVYQFNVDSFDALESKVNVLIGNNSGSSLRTALVKYFGTAFEKNGEWGVEIYSNELMVNYHNERASYELTQKVMKSIKDIEILKVMVTSIQKEYAECLTKYSPNDKNTTFLAELNKCDKKKEGGLIFSLAKDLFEVQVASHYPKNSVQASKILNPIHYLNECIKRVDEFEGMGIDEFRKFAVACTDIAQIDIAHNINLNLIESYKPVIRGQNIRKPNQIDYSCQKDIILNIHNKVGSNSDLTLEAFKAEHKLNGKMVRPIYELIMTKIRAGKGDGSLLMYLDESNQFDYDFKYWDNKNIKNLLSTLAKNDSVGGDHIKELTDICLKSVKDELYLKFKDYIISVIPAAFDGSQINRAGESNIEVIDKIVDLEMIDLIIKFKSLKGDEDGVLNSTASPLDKVITPAMGIQVLSNMIAVVGSYISKGFVFDPDRMKTELVVFKAEFKNALHWINTTTDVVRVRDLERFFIESKVADHLALAEVSENVYRQFMNFITEMEREDFESFKRRTGNRSYGSLSTAQRNDYRSLGEKYRKLKSLVRKMTSSYDFRRIMRTGSRRGEQVLDFIKENYLLVRVLGDNVSSTTKRKIGFDVARLIVRDNTEGGFAEQFVKNIAQHSLNVQSNNKWSITKWLFYDKGDFNWSHLRRTTAGRKALTYYCEYILLPKMLNAKLSKTVMRQRTEHFSELLKEAQGQN
ncbi:MAG: hypothetical protein KC493_00030 [Bacteriovoracaceae bacterium]|nr:hypothetical protein [Bacteriovoracaceae bacterium]